MSPNVPVARVVRQTGVAVAPPTAGSHPSSFALNTAPGGASTVTLTGTGTSP